ncbi:unnamed protein product [Moneuplotes crassus]|uniref:Uncharacterized protein n=1 Tax=Euplotes crassus TaxID=5936 RepID=A0AAD1XVR1_EUPCR|nr:unnamed protein product [Moneuplotes crassus]
MDDRSSCREFFTKTSCKHNSRFKKSLKNLLNLVLKRHQKAKCPSKPFVVLRPSLVKSKTRASETYIIPYSNSSRPREFVSRNDFVSLKPYCTSKPPL